jgi:excisionase family DNA binding protein
VAAKPSAVLPAVLTVREAAAFLKVSTAIIYRLCETGQLEHYRIESAIRIPGEAIDRFLTNARKVPT